MLWHAAGTEKVPPDLSDQRSRISSITQLLQISFPISLQCKPICSHTTAALIGASNALPGGKGDTQPHITATLKARAPETFGIKLFQPPMARAEKTKQPHTIAWSATT